MQQKRRQKRLERRLASGWLAAASLAVLPVGCGGSASSGVDAAGADSGADAAAGSAGFSGGGSGGRDAGRDAGGAKGGVAGVPVDSGYVDPGCPDAAPPDPVRECDPFAVPNGCALGDACYPFVNYPSGVCDQETFGTLCLPHGTGTQGDPCAGEPCASGFVCVVTGQGNQCVQLCPLQGEDGCPPGLFCVPVDVEGFGACF